MNRYHAIAVALLVLFAYVAWFNITHHVPLYPPPPPD